MIYRKESCQISIEKINEFHELFRQYELPNRTKHGAKLIGRWTTENGQQVIVIWGYTNVEEYKEIEARVRKDTLYQQMQTRLQELSSFLLASHQEFVFSTELEDSPKQNVVVSGYITNEQSEVLLVKTFWRSDTWELPGGAVDEGETLDIALRREIFEETGIKVKMLGVTGVYSNGHTVTIVFRGKAIGGTLKTSNETSDVRFVKIDATNVSDYVKRGKFIPRVMDGMKGRMASFESFKVRPYQLLERMNASEEENTSDNSM